jgi:septin family protein
MPDQVRHAGQKIGAFLNDDASSGCVGILPVHLLVAVFPDADRFSHTALILWARTKIGAHINKISISIFAPVFKMDEIHQEHSTQRDRLPFDIPLSRKRDTEVVCVRKAFL